MEDREKERELHGQVALPANGPSHERRLSMRCAGVWVQWFGAVRGQGPWKLAQQGPTPGPTGQLPTRATQPAVPHSAELCLERSPFICGSVPGRKVTSCVRRGTDTVSGSGRPVGGSVGRWVVCCDVCVVVVLDAVVLVCCGRGDLSAVRLERPLRVRSRRGIVLDRDRDVRARVCSCANGLFEVRTESHRRQCTLRPEFGETSTGQRDGMRLKPRPEMRSTF